jgi:hypothetical protein
LFWVLGFTFDDETPEATPLTAMSSLLHRNANYQDAVLPYIGGEEVNTSPELANRRWVINFGKQSLAEARSAFPALLEIVNEKVRPISS